MNCNQAADFVEILEIIDRDLGLGLAAGIPIAIPTTVNNNKDKTEKTPEKPVKPYQFLEQKFPLAELMYWQQYGITPELLEHYKVCSLREYQSVTAEGQAVHLYFISNRTYVRVQEQTVYQTCIVRSRRPVSYMVAISEKLLFRVGATARKGDTLFITGGEKDVISLAAHGFHAICFNSETVTIPPTLIYRLTFRFKHIVLLI